MVEKCNCARSLSRIDNLPFFRSMMGDVPKFPIDILAKPDCSDITPPLRFHLNKKRAKKFHGDELAVIAIRDTMMSLIIVRLSIEGVAVTRTYYLAIAYYEVISINSMTI
jgi:hypothetical protein